MVFLHELVRILFQIEKLNMLHPGFGHLVLGQFPVPLLRSVSPGVPHRNRPRTRRRGLFLVAHEDRLETNPLGGFRSIDLGQVTQGGQGRRAGNVPGNP